MEVWTKNVGQGDKRQPMKFLPLIQSSISFPVLKHQDQSHLGRTGFISAYRWEAILKGSHIRNMEVPEAEAAENH